MKNSKYFRQAQYKQGFVVPMIFAIIAVLLIAGGVYWTVQKKTVNQNVQSTTATSTVNWKTYIFHSVSIKIPPDLTIAVDPNTNDFTCNEYQMCNKDVILTFPAPYLSGSNLSAYIKLTENGLPLEGGVASYNGGLWKKIDSQIHYNEIKHGYVRRVAYYNNSAKVSLDLELFSSNEADLSGAVVQQVIHVLDEMVQSYKKVKQEPIGTTTQSTADWKTYTNDKYGFSFKYPASFVVQNQQENPSYFDFGLSIDSSDPCSIMMDVAKKDPAATYEALVPYRNDKVIRFYSIVYDGDSAQGVSKSRIDEAGAACSANLKKIVSTLKLFDQSKIVAPIKVLYPNGGENFRSEDIITVKWVTPGFELSHDVVLTVIQTSGQPYTGKGIVMEQTVSNTGSYQLHLPRVLKDSEKYIIKVSIPNTPNNFLANDISDSDFTITN